MSIIALNASFPEEYLLSSSFTVFPLLSLTILSYSLRAISASSFESHSTNESISILDNSSSAISVRVFPPIYISDRFASQAIDASHSCFTFSVIIVHCTILSVISLLFLAIRLLNAVLIISPNLPSSQRECISSSSNTTGSFTGLAPISVRYFSAFVASLYVPSTIDASSERVVLFVVFSEIRDMPFTDGACSKVKSGNSVPDLFIESISESCWNPSCSTYLAFQERTTVNSTGYIFLPISFIFFTISVISGLLADWLKNFTGMR